MTENTYSNKNYKQKALKINVFNTFFRFLITIINNGGI